MGGPRDGGGGRGGETGVGRAGRLGGRRKEDCIWVQRLCWPASLRVVRKRGMQANETNARNSRRQRSEEYRHTEQGNKPHKKGK